MEWFALNLTNIYEVIATSLLLIKLDARWNKIMSKVRW